MSSISFFVAVLLGGSDGHASSTFNCSEYGKSPHEIMFSAASVIAAEGRDATADGLEKKIAFCVSWALEHGADPWKEYKPALSQRKDPRDLVFSKKNLFDVLASFGRAALADRLVLKLRIPPHSLPLKTRQDIFRRLKHERYLGKEELDPKSSSYAPSWYEVFNESLYRGDDAIFERLLELGASVNEPLGGPNLSRFLLREVLSSPVIEPGTSGYRSIKAVLEHSTMFDMPDAVVGQYVSIPRRLTEHILHFGDIFLLRARLKKNAPLLVRPGAKVLTEAVRYPALQGLQGISKKAPVDLRERRRQRHGVAATRSQSRAKPSCALRPLARGA